MLHHTIYAHPRSDQWVTFIHGAGGSSSVWFKQVRAFSEQFNVLLLDLRGHGLSGSAESHTAKRYTFEEIAGDVIAVMDHRTISKSHFVGISLGTIIIRELAERHPDRVSSMILGGAVMQLNLRSRLLVVFGNLVKSMVPYMFLYKLYAWILLPKRNHRESRLLFIREAKRLAQKEFIRWFAMTSQLSSLLKFFREKESGIPTLYLMGEEDHMFLPSVRRIAGSHESASLEVVPSCGHVVNVEQPHLFNRSAIQFIQGNKS